MIYIKNEHEIELMRIAAQIVAKTLAELKAYIKPGISTESIDRLAEQIIRGHGAIPTFKNYGAVNGKGGFPGSVCISVNEEVVHGIPGKRILKEGDIVSLDCGAMKSGYHGDAAITVPVGKISPELAKLIKVTEECLYKGIVEAVIGKRISDISNAVQVHAEKNGFSVVRSYVGHGIGQEMHEEPQVPNYGKPGRGPRLEAGMVLAIEPMINAGIFAVETLQDGWTVITKDGKASAHFEHDVAITANGPLILSLL